MDTPFLPGFRPSLAALGRSLRSVRSKPIPELQLFFKSLFPDHVFDREAAGPNSRDRIFTVTLHRESWAGRLTRVDWSVEEEPWARNH